MLRTRAITIILAAGGAVLAPLCAFGHGVEFLSARLTLLPHAEVLLEITADYGSNPMLTDEHAARAALADPIRLRSKEDDALIPLAVLAIPTLTSHDNWAEFAPASYLPDDTSTEAHQLLTSSWRWRSTTPEITFQMPKGKLHDVLLWTRDQTHPDAPPKWILLLSGDRSKPIPVAWPPWWQRWPTLITSCIVSFVMILFLTSRQRSTGSLIQSSPTAPSQPSNKT